MSENMHQNMVRISPQLYESYTHMHFSRLIREFRHSTELMCAGRLAADLLQVLTILVYATLSCADMNKSNVSAMFAKNKFDLPSVEILRFGAVCRRWYILSPIEVSRTECFYAGEILKFLTK